MLAEKSRSIFTLRKFKAGEYICVYYSAAEPQDPVIVEQDFRRVLVVPPLSNPLAIRIILRTGSVLSNFVWSFIP